MARGKIYTTPGTKETWDDIATWLTVWNRLKRRRARPDTYRKCEAHVEMLVPLVRGYLSVIFDPVVLAGLRSALKTTHYSLGGQPCRGARADHPTTTLIVEINNRIRTVERMLDHASMSSPSTMIGHNWRGQGQSCGLSGSRGQDGKESCV